MNVIVATGRERDTDRDLFFPGEDVCVVTPDADMYDLLVLGKFFKSRTEARKNWQRSGRKVPRGFSHFTRIGKLRKELAILNP